jgi:epoxyqueuosine reductase QueG
MLCAKMCPTQAFTKEVDGMLTVDFGERQFSFPNKNLWRCAAGENFNLDVYADWPGTIDEAVINTFGEKAARTNPELRYGWKMGLCLKYCVPRTRRRIDRSYAPSPRRLRDVAPDMSDEGLDKAAAGMLDLAERIDVDYFAAVGREELEKNEIELSQFLPGAESALLVGQRHPPHAPGEAGRAAGRNALWIAKVLQNRYGFDAIVESGLAPASVMDAISFDGRDFEWKMSAIVASLPVRGVSERFLSDGAYRLTATQRAPEPLRKRLEEIVRQAGSELFGVTPVSRLDDIAGQLESLLGREDYFIAYEMGWGEKSRLPMDMRARPANPGIKDVALIPRRAREYVTGAKSVIVIGLRLLEGSVENAGRPPAYKAGHYAVSAGMESIAQNEAVALKVANFLHENGYRAAITNDLEGLASENAGTAMLNLQANRFPAIAAGLGDMGLNGLALTPEFGSRVRFVAVVTDAELPYDDAYGGDRLCAGCGVCVSACPVRALSDKDRLEITVDGRAYRWATPDLLRCDWAARYGLTKEEGPGLIGSLNDFPPPEKITREALKDAVIAADRIQKTEYCTIVERCFTECPKRGEWRSSCTN